jgi:hypothetical protein
MTTLMQHIKVPAKDGLKKTLELMNYLEKLSFQNVDFVNFVFKNFSSNCTACIPGKIWNYMQKNFTYQSDDPFDEIITAPYILLKTKRGDCDDFSLFAKTCIDILGGFSSNYILFSKEKNNQFSHIACFVNRGTFNNTFIDPVIIDGANQNFNIIPNVYKFYKLV